MLRKCDAAGPHGGDLFPRIVWDRPAGQTWGGDQRVVGVTCLECKRAHRPATETTMRVAKIYTVPAHLYRFHAPSRCYDVFVGGRFLGRELDYFSCDEMADDYRFAQQADRELAAAQMSGELIDAQQAAAVTALQTLGATQALALRIRDEDDLEFEVAA